MVSQETIDAAEQLRRLIQPAQSQDQAVQKLRGSQLPEEVKRDVLHYLETDSNADNRFRLLRPALTELFGTNPGSA